MPKGYITLPDGKKAPFVQIDKQKYATSILWSESVTIAADSFQFQNVTIVLPSYNYIKLSEIYAVCYANRSATDSLVPDLVYFTVAGDNSAGYGLSAFPAGVTIDPVQARYSFKGEMKMQNLGIRFTRDNTTIICAFIKESGLLIGDNALLAMRFVFEDVDS